MYKYDFNWLKHVLNAKSQIKNDNVILSGWGWYDKLHAHVNICS